MFVFLLLSSIGRADGPKVEAEVEAAEAGGEDPKMEDLTVLDQVHCRFKRSF
jgi:hypothetical protein